MKREKHDVLKWTAVLFALVATASAEYDLARAVGYSPIVAAAVPGALDVYTVRAMRMHRDVLASVIAMVAVNAASHLVSAGLLPVNIPLVVGVSAIAPLVLYRVHHISRTPHAPAPAGQPEVQPEPAPEPRVHEPVPAPPPPFVLDLARTDSHPHPDVCAPVAALDRTRRTRVHATVPNAPAPARTPVRTRPKPKPAPHAPADGPDPLLDAARNLPNGPDGVPVLRTLKTELGIGQTRAQALQAALQN